ncbi:BsuPI-related putative proteinase inhibitor [Alkaliphilus peptidifermentans]|uniref:Intracellular proteinase inhibitor n=1 Tax=Alkaliphilus peptidifermentans DSM 18978 TaxID=1120976 RepID=A0A1G5JNU1_9FIRM|nr:BsuPI-related putative proteinase inhibitor [Alkaliphilus peptidifermentans]SCY89561.1 Intracellular proteinase inhibitor [Alkaliphilus peptidifermentans DSM 18978]
MKKKTIFIIATSFFLSMFLIFNGFAQEVEPNINQHWGQPYLEQLQQISTINITTNDLDKDITIEEIDMLIKTFISEDYELELKDTTRESVVNGLIKLWSEKTNNPLEEIVLPMVVVFEDEENINTNYRWNVLIAYYQGLVQGSNGYFMPESNITYAEAYALITRLIDIISVDKGNSDDVVADGVKTDAFETKGSYEIKDNSVVFDFELINHHNKTQKMEFSSGQQFEVIIANEEGKEIYRYSDGKFFTMALVYLQMKPGESISWSDTWDMKDKNGVLIEEGEFTATIRILAMNREEIKISKEELGSTINFSLIK